MGLPHKHEDLKEGHLDTLRHISPLSYGVERVFYLLSKLTPERLFGPTRADIQTTHAVPSERMAAAQKRGRRIEIYLLLWIGIEIAAVAFGTACENRWVTWFFMAAMIGRIVDIIQITGNVSLFDRLKINWKYYYIENTVRTILLSLINYLELIVCFGFIYCVFGRNGGSIAFKESLYDGYYFSGVTQLTIGYGDIHPYGLVKYVALLQGFIGFIYTILILGRFISLLPEIKE